MNRDKARKLSLLAIIMYLLMVGVNIAANLLPINGNTTGQVSDSYPNLFAPAGYTFAIWGLIYIALAFYSYYSFKGNVENRQFIPKVDKWFLLSSLANIMWILAWHYRYIGLSLILILLVLFSLFNIIKILNSWDLTKKERRFISLPFNIYFGWITVASIANLVTYLVSIGWNGFGISQEIWTMLALMMGVVIILLIMVKDRNIAYGLTTIWAYIGILVKHLSKDGFNMEYKNIIYITLVAIIIIAYTVVKSYRIKKLQK